MRRRVTPLLTAALAPLLYLLLAVLGHLPAFGSLATRTQCACKDGPQTDWFLGWTVDALRAGRTPFTTDVLSVPDGVNLMWNTLLPLPGLVAAPVTLTLGVLASHTLLAVLAFAGSATSMWAVAGRWAPWLPARFAAGLLYGFSPYLVAQGSGHLNLSLVALPPLVLLLLDDLLVRQDRSAVRRGLLLGLVATAQLLTTEEVLASTFVVCLLGLLVLVAQHPRAVRARLRHGVVGLSTATVLGAVLVAYPLWVQFTGPRRVTAPVQDASPYAADLLGVVVPTVFQLLGNDVARGWGGNPSENGSYLGAPLLLVLVGLAVAFRRVPVVRFAATLGVVAWAVSLGERLHVAGTAYAVPLPFALVSRVPVLENLAAVRFSLYVVLCGSLVLAVGLDRLHASGRLRALPTGFVAVACLVPLLPAWPYEYVEARTPAYFTTSAVRAVPEGSVALTYPVPRFPESAPMLWQAEAGFRYRSLGGYVITPQPSGAGTFLGSRSDLERLFADVRRGAPVPRSGALDAKVLADLARLDVDSVLVATSVPGAQEAVRYFSLLLRRAPDEVTGGVAAWYRVSG
ncbi:MAG: hypothetical protein JWM64_2179 [Frankiales bacterium]|nr:hypothetical protein [Frankiales bacterium]